MDEDDEEVAAPLSLTVALSIYATGESLGVLRRSALRVSVNECMRVCVLE
jgi:hypothetical protein